jgi:hypothetical protein
MKSLHKIAIKLGKDPDSLLNEILSMVLESNYKCLEAVEYYKKKLEISGRAIFESLVIRLIANDRIYIDQDLDAIAYGYLFFDKNKKPILGSKLFKKLLGKKYDSIIKEIKRREAQKNSKCKKL